MNSGPTGVVMTSISAPNAAMSAVAGGCAEAGYPFWVIGDVSSPPNFHLEGCSFSSIDQQRKSGFRIGELCPVRHYARKNIGYLMAIRAGVDLMLEIDDDNIPRPDFWRVRDREHSGAVVAGGNWINIYAYFTDSKVWPRGFPLDELGSLPPPRDLLPRGRVACPIQQGLADVDPDVDAVYRLLFPLPVSFENRPPVALAEGSWCPFNSQNTAWFREAFPLLYLPAYCSFRMSDIWRSFIAQRICWENGWAILFSNADVYQERNAHNLMRDFEDEVPGYLGNRRIARILEDLTLSPGAEALTGNLVKCYEALIGQGIMDAREMPLLEAWNADFQDAARYSAGGRALEANHH